jgi:hypothetical protein
MKLILKIFDMVNQDIPNARRTYITVSIIDPTRHDLKINGSGMGLIFLTD